MKVTIFSSKPYDEEFFNLANRNGHTLQFIEARLTPQTVNMAVDSAVVCGFVNDEFNRDSLDVLSKLGVRLIALRCAGFNNVDLAAAAEFNIKVTRVPAYSPFAVAEHTVGLMLALNRHLHRAYNRIREGDFRLQGLLGFDFHEKTVGIVGTGSIGRCVAQIMKGFGCRVLAFDIVENPTCVQLGVRYVGIDELLSTSDIVTLHCPLTPETRHLLNENSIATMKPNVMVINTGRGALAKTSALIDGLKSGRIGWLGLDVYEEEADLFFEDHSDDLLQDDVFARLLTFPNVLITGHQAFFTREALTGIATTTMKNIQEFSDGVELTNAIRS